LLALNVKSFTGVIVLEKIKGLRLELIDQTIVEVYTFSSTSDYVAVTMGTNGGPLCGPIYQYKIISETSLMIYDDSSFSIIWEEIEFNQNMLTVKSNGNKATYQMTKNN